MLGLLLALVALVVLGAFVMKVSVALLVTVIWAFICGLIAEKLVGGGPGGILGNIVVGLVGGVVGRLILPGSLGHGLLGTTLGAVIFLVIWKAFTRK